MKRRSLYVFVQAAEITQVSDSIALVRCGSGNVYCTRLDGLMAILAIFGQRCSLGRAGALLGLPPAWSLSKARQEIRMEYVVFDGSNDKSVECCKIGSPLKNLLKLR